MYEHKLFYGIAFALGFAVLLVLLVRPFLRRREESARRAEMGPNNWPKAKKMRKSPEKDDPPLHVDANTMPLGLKKLVKTGTDFDKG